MIFATFVLSVVAVIISISSALSSKRSADAADRQSRAAEEQVKHARAQAQAAQAQADAALQQVDAMKQQIEAASRDTDATLLIAERQSEPRFSIEPGTVQGVIQRDTIEFRNIGDGIAHNLELAYQDGLPGDEVRLSNSSVPKNASITVPIHGDRAAMSGLFLTYETLFGKKYVLSFKWNGHASQAVGVKLEPVS
jgi:hypothetical protein